MRKNYTYPDKTPFTALDRNGERVMLRYDDGDSDTEWFQVENGPAIHDAA